MLIACQRPKIDDPQHTTFLSSNYTYIYMYMHRYTYVYIYVHTYTYTHIHTYAWTYTYTYAYIYIHIHIRIHIFTRTYGQRQALILHPVKTVVIAKKLYKSGCALTQFILSFRTHLQARCSPYIALQHLTLPTEICNSSLTRQISMLPSRIIMISIYCWNSKELSSCT